jgi:hypothetical protein
MKSIKIPEVPTLEEIVKEIKTKRLLELRDIKGARLDNISMNDQRWHGGGISNISGLISAGTNVTITGSGTSSDPYVINSSGGGGGSQTLAQTLVLGNVTGGNDIEMSAGDYIVSPNAQTQLEISDSGFVMTTDGGGFGTPYMTLTPTQIELAGLGGGGILFTLGSLAIAHNTLIDFTTATPVRFSGLTASTVPYLDASKNLVSSAVTPTELGYLSGVTSAIQTQLNGKQATLTPAALTRTDDTNVTLTLGGTPATSLLQAVSLTLGWSGQLSLARGGTGANLSDPGANAVFVWDDTTNATRLALLSGLSYDSGTNTLSATGGVPTQITVANEATDTSCFVAFFTAASGNLEPKTNANLTFNSNTGVLTFAQTAVGSISGNAGTATALQNARTIGGVSFDGTGNITVASATGGFTVSGGALALGVNDLTMTGSLGATGARVLKGWFTDLEVTNAIAGSITGNAATVTVANEATDTTCFVAFFTAASGSLAPKTNTNMTFNSNTGVVTLASSILTTTDINGGTIDGTIIGGASAAAGTFTTHTSNNLLASSNDSGAIGASGTAFSDLFLASGGVINWNAGNATITHSASLLTINVPVSIGTANAFTAGSIELGAAADTTITRGAAGFIAIEGNRVPSPASQASGDVLYRGATEWERLGKGTAGQVLTMNAGATAPEWATPAAPSLTYKSGVATRVLDTVSGVQNIAHGLGKTPLKVRITAIFVLSGLTEECFGVFDSSGNRGMTIAMAEGGSSATTDVLTTSTTYAIGFGRNIGTDPYGAGDNTKAIITVDGTNIILTWTTTATAPAATASILWEVE